MERELRNQAIPLPSASTPLPQEISGASKNAFNQKMCVHSQNPDQDVTEDQERR
jgi:hypothetical protein